MHHTLTILGSGYTARFLVPLAERRYRSVLATSRDPERHLRHLKAEQRIRFDLTRPDTWTSIPTGTDVLWCFPALPLHAVQEFAEAASLRTRRAVVLGSTSAYDDGTVNHSSPPSVDESAPIDLSKPRVQGEELLRTDYSAIVLRVSGIYGPGRNPIDWIRTGRVRRSGKYVNLIHVEDLAVMCLAALSKGDRSGIYNVSDGTPRTWHEICDRVERRWAVRASASEEPTTSGKRIVNKRMSELLHVDGQTLRFTDLYEALEDLQNNALNEGGPSQ